VAAKDLAPVERAGEQGVGLGKADRHAARVVQGEESLLGEPAAHVGADQEQVVERQVFRAHTAVAERDAVEDLDRRADILGRRQHAAVGREGEVEVPLGKGRHGQDALVRDAEAAIEPGAIIDEAAIGTAAQPAGDEDLDVRPPGEGLVERPEAQVMDRRVAGEEDGRGHGASLRSGTLARRPGTAGSQPRA
jgi:hypothetical protein